MIRPARPCLPTARAGSFMLGLLLLLSGCDISTDNLTPQNIGAAILRSICRSQTNCYVDTPP